MSKLWPVKATRPIHVALVAATQARVPALNNWMLHDIGIPVPDAIFLSGKPFWTE
jgi:hypothetical protein